MTLEEYFRIAKDAIPSDDIFKTKSIIEVSVKIGTNYSGNTERHYIDIIRIPPRNSQISLYTDTRLGYCMTGNTIISTGWQNEANMMNVLQRYNGIEVYSDVTEAFKAYEEKCLQIPFMIDEKMKEFYKVKKQEIINSVIEYNDQHF